MGHEVAHPDVVRLVLQFLEENNLHDSFATLRRETGISVNAVRSAQEVTRAVEQGKWDVALRLLRHVDLPSATLFDMYEQMALELVEAGEYPAVRALLRQATPLLDLSVVEPKRFNRLDELSLEAAEKACDEITGEVDDAKHSQRRQEIAQALAKDMRTVPPSRLLTLLGQALQWQEARGLLHTEESSVDVFLDEVSPLRQDTEALPTISTGVIKFPSKNIIEVVTFSQDARALITGSSDGFIEAWDPVTRRLRHDLTYQEETPMMMESAVLGLALSDDMDTLASGSQDGVVKIWRLATGKCVLQINAHAQAITKVGFFQGSALTSSLDGTLRLYGLKSGQLLREFRGHGGFVNTFATVGARLVSGSGDGSVRIWDLKTAQCYSTLVPSLEGSASRGEAHGEGDAVVAICPLDAASVVVATCRAVYIVPLDGKGTVRCIVPPGKTVILTCAISPKGKYVHILCNHNHLRSYDTDQGTLEQSHQVCEDELVAITASPHSSHVAVTSDRGRVYLYHG